MWKKLAAASALALALAAAFCAAPRAALAAADAKRPAIFGAGPQTPLLLTTFNPSSAGQVLYRSPASRPFAQSYDTALFDGQCRDAGMIFEFSKLMPDGAWSPWAAARVHRHRNGRFWGQARLPKGAGPLRFRIVDGGWAASASVMISGVEVNDSAQRNSNRAAQSLAPPFPAPPLPSFVHSRKEWGARPSRNPYVPMQPWRITIHHTAGLQTMNLPDTLREVRFIQDFQQNGRGWDDIAYHFLIDGAGDVIEGRPVNAVGAHTQGYNDGNIGISMMGYFNAPVNDHLTQAQMGALVRLLDYLVATYDIRLSEIRGHRDYNKTACPGDNVYLLIPSIRGKISIPRTVQRPSAPFKAPTAIFGRPAWLPAAKGPLHPVSGLGIFWDGPPAAL